MGRGKEAPPKPTEDEKLLLEEMEKLKVRGRSNIKLPIVLDEDPVQAANSLTLEDELKTIELMKSTYKSLYSEKQVNIALERAILYSNFNFEWFASFTLELCRLNNETVGIPYDKIGELPEGSELFLFPPLKCSKYKVVADFPRGTQIYPITQYRILYISQAHEATEFRDGFPAWYTFSNTTLYERYSESTGVRARIDFNNGEFHYYVAGASDNWKQIVGVPLEMDGIIASLLFKN